jgi:O-acetyl-ADP-ribose deacetylase (regulator of RNase III)
MTNIIATIHCHTRESQMKVQDYICSAHYQMLLANEGADLRATNKPLTHADYDAVIAPGNSFGQMDGGFDQGLVDAFGPTIQDNVKNSIRGWHYGELNVGNAIIVPTGGLNIPYCAYAPTMRVPCKLPKDSDVPYLATRAGLIEMIQSPYLSRLDTIRVLIPLMGVGTGGLAVEYVCSQIQMAVRSALAAHRATIPNLEAGQIYDSLIRHSK